MATVADAYKSAANQIAEMKGVAQANNAFNAEQASIQREWQEKQNAKSMAFNQDEAAKNRNWQEIMSNTAHQREVKDLIAAGLNPVLSATGGNGAAVGSGATASGVTSAGAKGDADTSVNGAIANLLGSIMSAQTQLEAANINAKTQEAVAEQYNSMNHIIAQLQAETSRYAANMGYASAKYSADRSKFGLLGNVYGDFMSLLTGGTGVSTNSAKTGGKVVQAVENVLTGLGDSVKKNDGYPLITRLFPGLKNLKAFDNDPNNHWLEKLSNKMKNR